jgi:hypothetical protein
VEQLRLEPLLPGGALVDQRLAQPHPRAQHQDLRRRDPRLRQLPRREQPQQQTAVGPVGLRPPLAPTLGRGLRRIGQVRPMTRARDLLDDEPPARRPLQCDLHLIDAVEARQPLAHRFAGRGSDPPS